MYELCVFRNIPDGNAPTMSEIHNFTVRISTDDDVRRNTAAQMLQKMLANANTRHESINYVTVQHSEMDGAELGGMFDLLYRPTDEDIDRAIMSLNALEEDK